MYKILFLLLFAIPCFASEGSVYIKMSDGFYAGTEYKTSSSTTHIKSKIETKITEFSSSMFGFVPVQVVYDLEIGHKIDDEFQIIYRHNCPHAIDDKEIDYDYSAYNELSIRKYERVYR